MLSLSFLLQQSLDTTIEIGGLLCNEQTYGNRRSPCQIENTNKSGTEVKITRSKPNGGLTADEKNGLATGLRCPSDRLWPLFSS